MGSHSALPRAQQNQLRTRGHISGSNPDRVRSLRWCRGVVHSAPRCHVSAINRQLVFTDEVFQLILLTS